MEALFFPLNSACVLITMAYQFDPLDGIPHDLAILDTCIKALVDDWRVGPDP
jgi:hypothetical protein